MKKYYIEFVRRNEQVIKRELSKTVTDKDNTLFGGVYDVDGIIEPNHVIGNLLNFTSAYFCEDSTYYKDNNIYDALMASYKYIDKVQREDGTIDFLRSNFFAAPGFEMHSLGRAYKIMDKYAKTSKELELKQNHFNTLKAIARGLYNGGFHTPNHRWVDAAGLSLAYNITNEEYLKEKALKYLAEGIDIDENGDFTERSPGIYNAVNDNALFIVAEELDKPELYEHIDKNMKLIYSYLEPDGSIFTQNSTRQDKGEAETGRAFYPTNYYHIYLKGALVFNNKQYAKFADTIIKEAIRDGRALPNVLWMYLIEDNLKEATFEFVDIPTIYEKFYDTTNIVRRRNNDFSVSLLGNNANFIFIQKGKLRCYARMSASFFAVAQFRASKIIKTDIGYQMSFTAHGSYKKPFDNPPKTSDWRKMDHSKRAIVNEVELTYIVNFTMLENGVQIHVITKGCDRVPMKIEFCFSPNSKIFGDGYIIHGTPGGYLNAAKGNIKVVSGEDTISIGPAFSKHDYTYNLRGSVSKSRNDFTIYFTEFTNIDKTIDIICE